LLPAWWASEGDSIIAPYPWVEEDTAWLTSEWGLRCDTSLRSTPYDASPWGWSEDAHRQFTTAGIDGAMLPSAATLSRLRELSHRRSSIAILSALGKEDLLPEEITDPHRALQLEDECKGHFFKSPWSCSGRGVFCAQGLSRNTLFDKAAGIIHRQGSVMAERGYRKIAEFGALYECDRYNAKFRGMSMFLTEPRGTYAGNIIANQDYFISKIDSLGLLGEVNETTTRLENVLTELLIPHFTGWLGIDMMAYKGDDGKTHLHPCIELNLRMTMGVVAMKIADRISPTRPMLMDWRRDNPTTHQHLLLPPHEGFALVMQEYNN